MYRIYDCPQRRLAPIERTALERFPIGRKTHRQFGTPTALGQGTAAFLRGAA